MTQSRESKNKALVSRRSTPCSTSETMWRLKRFWSPDYIQHSAHIKPGREGLFNLIKSAPVDAEVRARRHRGRRGTSSSPTDGSLDMGARGAGCRRTLCALPTMSWPSMGCPAGRGDSRGVREWPAYVW
jgi:hypothetical protein